MIGKRFGGRSFTRVGRFGMLAFAALALAACGGGGGGGAPAAPSPEELEEVRSDPRVVRLGDILARSDALLVSGSHIRYSISGGGETLTDDSVETLDCAGARCEAADGTAITAADLTGSGDIEVRLSVADLGERGGFDTAATQGTFEVTESVQRVRVTTSPDMRSYGFWGAHGYAALELGMGPLTGEAGETTFAGNFSLARAYAAGDASGTNPAGAGGATWRGVVEASPTGSFARLQGTVTVTIADLASPRVGVSVSVPGHSVVAPGWADMPLAMGRFSTGTVGSDYLAGTFHGPGHEEAWGVFDTEQYLGAFGAKRAP